MIALGYPGDPDSLTEKLRQRETAQRKRKPLASICFFGRVGTSGADRWPAKMKWPSCSNSLSATGTCWSSRGFLSNRRACRFLRRRCSWPRGRLQGRTEMNLGVAIAFATIGAMASDGMWYELGRLKGVRVLQLLCRISLEPDSCVRRSQVSFGRNGPRVLLVAKFVPGLNAMAAPLSGVIRMGWRHSFSLTRSGRLLWVSAFTITGYTFSSDLERVAARAAYLGEWLVVLVAGRVRRLHSLEILQSPRVPAETEDRAHHSRRTERKNRRRRERPGGRSAPRAGLRRQPGNDSRRAARRCRGTGGSVRRHSAGPRDRSVLRVPE